MKILTNSQFISLVLTLVYFVQVARADDKIEFPNEGGGWLRMCDTTETYIGAEKSDGCKEGFWFEPAISVGCVCGHGVWILSNGWCDPNYITLTLKNGTCFYIGENDIRFIRQIGYAKNAYAEYHFVYSSGFEYVQGLTDGGNDPIYSFYHPSYDNLLGSIRPSGLVILGKDGRTCVDTRDMGVFTTFVYDTRLKENVRRQGYTLAKSCSVGRDEISDSDLHAFPIRYAGKARAITSDWSKPTKMYVNDATKCDKCDATKAPAGAVGYIPSWDHPGWSPSSPRPRTEFKLEPDLPAGFNTEDYPQGLENNLTEYFQEINCQNYTHSKGSKNATLLEINEQTKRMISAHIAYSLRKIQTPAVNISDYKLFQKSRMILNKVCPETEVPTELLNGLVRMFRVALKESLLLYPYQQTFDADITKKISEALDLCSTEAQKMFVNYDNTTCPNTFIALNYTYKKPSDVTRNLSTGIPCALETNGSSYDLPMEVAWKSIMFTHYYCARHFKAFALGHSTFEQIMESFFNRWIQHRWRNPGASYKAYKFIFQMHDLQKFSKNLDRCVAASRSYSPYRKWIRRPSFPTICGVDIFTANGLVSNIELLKLTASNQNAGKTRFNKKAYCSQVWHEPQTLFKLKPQSSKKSSSCIQYVPEEWVDGQEPNDPWKQGVGSRKTLRQEIFETLLGGGGGSRTAGSSNPLLQKPSDNKQR